MEVLVANLRIKTRKQVCLAKILRTDSKIRRQDQMSYRHTTPFPSHISTHRNALLKLTLCC